MKKIFIFVFILAFFSVDCFGAEIFTAPIDSRPVSVEYMERLSKLSGDGFYCVSKENLDYFSGKTELDHLGNSRAVREEIYNMARDNNNSDSVFIINLSSYLTGGLVGGRTAQGYVDSGEAIADFEKLLRDFPNPKYYINMTMPRTLPETRLGEIWEDGKYYEGLGSFYQKNNPDSPIRDEIAAKYAHVTAPQLLLEWAYVKNHERIGELYDWEKNFLAYFEANYETKDPYKKYLKAYRMPYLSLAEFGEKIMELTRKYDFELIVSVDDFQLPDFITCLNDRSLMDDEIKYSFALNYMQNILYGRAKYIFGEQQLNLAKNGKGSVLNFIFGTDEVPQLIYARALSERTKISPNLLAVGEKTDIGTGNFDVKTASELLETDINFVSAGNRKSRVRSDIFMYDYKNPTNVSSYIDTMKKSYKAGRNPSLIELYTTNETGYGANHLFKTLMKLSAEGKDFGFHSLAAYSSWNTQANAVGLGAAAAAVFSINMEINNTKAFRKSQLELLIGHGLEDGWYNCEGKRQLYGYYPYYDENSDKKLKSIFDGCSLTKGFEGREYRTDEGIFKVLQADEEYSFPWQRTFECYIKPNVKEDYNE